MVKTLQIDGRDYDLSDLSADGREALAAYLHVNARLKEAENFHAVLNKARHAYIADIKNEMIQGKTGIDLSALFSD
jgi:hypothetical protein